MRASQSTFTSLLGIDLPIVQAPMAGVQDARLAIAVSQAGGLGSLPCAMLGIDTIREQVAQVRTATDRPFNLNFFCHVEREPEQTQIDRWHARFAPYYREFNLDGVAIPTGARRRPFDAELAELVLELRPPVVSFHFGLPALELLDAVRASGAYVMSSATTVDEAHWLEQRGVDAVIAQGAEAGGHRGMFLTDDISTQVGTLALVAQAVNAVEVPVIAAGGIADARGVRATLELGAVAVQVGTSYLLCDEATTSAVHRHALRDAGRRETALTNVFTGRPARSIVNRMVRELGPMSADALPFPLAGGASGPLRAAAEAAGSGDFSPLWSGQDASGADTVSAAEITRRLSGHG